MRIYSLLTTQSFIRHQQILGTCQALHYALGISREKKQFLPLWAVDLVHVLKKGYFPVKIILHQLRQRFGKHHGSVSALPYSRDVVCKLLYFLRWFIHLSNEKYKGSCRQLLKMRFKPDDICKGNLQSPKHNKIVNVNIVLITFTITIIIITAF